MVDILASLEAGLASLGFGLTILLTFILFDIEGKEEWSIVAGLFIGAGIVLVVMPWLG